MAALAGLGLLWAWLAGAMFLLAHGHPVTQATPLTMYQYWAYYGTDAGVRRWLYGCAGVAAVLLAVPLYLLLRTRVRRSLFGDARFAEPRDVRRAGLLGERGILVGQYKGSYLMFGGSQHVIMSAPTRSGKGVGIVIPNLLTWHDSVVVLDIKQENHGITSGFRRKHGQQCFLFNPAAADYRSHRYNPLAYVSSDPHFRIDDVQKIASMLFPDEPGVDPIWTATPRALFLGIVLMLLETPGKLVTLGQVLRETLVDGDGAAYFGTIVQARRLGQRIAEADDTAAAQQAGRDADAVLADRARPPEQHPVMAEMAVWIQLSPAYRKALVQRVDALRRHSPRTPDLVALALATPADVAAARIGKALSPACERALNSYLSISADTTRSGIITSFRSRLELWYNPLVDAATSANDFDLRELRSKRMSIYLGVTPDNLDRMAPLLNLFFQQMIDLNTRQLPEHNAALKYQCLIVADEFTAMGKIQVLSKGISYIAGYGLRMLPIIQSPMQVVEVYGEHAAETFTTNHALQIVFPPKASETKTAEAISKWLGDQTVKAVSESQRKAMFARRERSESVSEQRRALMLPQEITSLGKSAELVIVEDCPPILAQRVRYFQDPVFIDRLKSVSPSLGKLGRKLPTENELKDAARRGELGAPVPLVDVAAHQKLVAESEAAPVPAAAGRTVNVVERPVAATEVDALAERDLGDFAVDFAAVPLPPAEEMDEAALLAYADSLCREAGILA
ncbi:type IV secretory system conjugative DNA transfer family protein [Pseudoduganella chitinolytica]|uniref:Type IV secretory system conjugative DNA transfer family protein n=1 Tax=Pseudoduganella chitinolytica TaxID=34070 RepID=A0ABY8BAR8_9BURK|nr:type IV secretory system conjugative DNA transfer family protein [Pseudoduganella chitinolytica]WEF31459.1 type IV secretory system conjugative DNA transfer family protein [Pseudoduganella chitinolytica]